MNFKLSDEESSHIYKKYIRKFVFSNRNEIPSRAKLIIVGAQPGAGKTNVMVKTFAELKGNAILINSDDYRRFHPNESEIFKQYGRDCSEYTHIDVSRWGDRALKEAREMKYNIITEKTLKSDRICNEIKEIKKDGYEVSMRVIAVNKLESQQGIYRRYEDQYSAYIKGDSNDIPRFVPKEIHNAGYLGVTKTLQGIEKEDLCPIEIYNRQGNLLYDSQNKNKDEQGNKISAVTQLEAARNAAWDINKYQAFTIENDKIIQQMEKRNEKPQFITEVRDLNIQSKDMLKIADRDIASCINDIKNSLPVKELSGVISSKTLYNSYAKETLPKTFGKWIEGKTDINIAIHMLEDGHKKIKIFDTLQNSPIVFGRSKSEGNKEITNFINDAMGKADLKKVKENNIDRNDLSR